MLLRPATAADIDALRRWDGAPHVAINSGTDDVMNWAHEVPRSVDWRDILIAEVAGRAIGVVVIIDPAREETHYWGDVAPNLRAIDIWIGEADMLNQGHGTAMMRGALARCFADPAVTAVLIDPLAANTDAHRFYRRLGFRFVEARRFGADDCHVHRIDRDAWAAMPC